MKFTDRKYGELKFTDRIKVEELEFTDRKQKNWSLKIESRRPGIYRQKVGELGFTDREYENWSLQIESKRTQFTDIKQGNYFWSLQIESYRRTGVYK